MRRQTWLILTMMFPYRFCHGCVSLQVPGNSYQVQGERFLGVSLLGLGFAGLSVIAGSVGALIPADAMGSFHLGGA